MYPQCVSDWPLIQLTSKRLLKNSNNVIAKNHFIDRNVGVIKYFNDCWAYLCWHLTIFDPTQSWGQKFFTV